MSGWCEAVGVLAALQGRFTETVTLEPYRAPDDYGEATYGPGVTVRARIEQGAREVRTAEGRLVTSMTRVYLAEAPAVVTPQDRITLPAPYQPAQPPILAITLSRDADGALVATVAC